MLRLGLTGPLDVPFGAVWAHDSEPSCLESIDNGVINVGGFGDFEAEHHIVLLKVVLPGHLDLLELSEVRLLGPVGCLQE